MDWHTQTVLVTGADGFIGSHLTERLTALGAHTRALVCYNASNSWGWLDHSDAKDDIEVVAGDIRDIDHLRQIIQGVDIVFHLAALIAIPHSYHTPRSYVQTNVEGTLNVLQAAREAKVSCFVHTSTSEVYGTAQYVPIDEDHPLQGQSPYAASKIGADKMAEAFHLSFGLPVATARPFNTFGPRQSARAIIPSIITQALTQPEIQLGNLAPRRDLNYVGDTVEGFIKIAESPQAIGQVVNLGSGREICMGDLAKTILRLIGTEKRIVCDAQRIRPGHSEVDQLCANNQKALTLLGWCPQYSLESGLLKTITWMEKHLERYRPGTYAI
ncbi:MAG: SDR family NAD(P)-dependent oxidoreductase [bacterium]|nr:SDR family NAD(P)-dependent oxidoreductase [bacterium]